jgi:lipoprotein-releasing system permease protein
MFSFVPMQVVSLIAQKMRGQSTDGTSRPIVWIALGAIILGMVTMLVALGMVNGFQKEIKSKMVGFGGHLKIFANLQAGGDALSPFERIDSVEKKILAHPMVKYLQPTIHLPGIIESKKELQGIVLKGIDPKNDTLFFQQIIQEGRQPNWNINADNDTIREVMISRHLQKELSVALNQKISLYFLNGNEVPQQQNFTICGIYESGLEEFDHKMVFIPLYPLQKYSRMGIKTWIQVETIDSQSNPLNAQIVAQVQSSSSDYQYHWKTANGKIYADTLTIENLEGSEHHFLLMATDNLSGQKDSVQISFKKSNDQGWTYDYQFTDFPAQKMVGSYEIALQDFDELLSSQNTLYDLLPYQLGIENVLERHPEIVAWLNMLDINVIIIIVMMIFIGIINMTSALLIIILERQNMIGTLKALGMPNKMLIKIFFRHALHLITKGVLIGNIIGLGLMAIQKYFKWIKLDPEQYYVSAVPIDFDWASIALLNIFVVLVCAVAMFIPALYVNRISPIKAIRFS